MLFMIYLQDVYNKYIMKIYIISNINDSKNIYFFLFTAINSMQNNKLKAINIYKYFTII